MSATVDPIYASVLRILRIGFRLAAGFLALGIVIALIRSQPLEREADPLIDIPGKLLDLHSSAFIDLAIVTIVLTPLVAVGAIWLGFRRKGEDRFALYSAGVLVILAASITLSLFR
jgi:uncharacterized membrane protein